MKWMIAVVVCVLAGAALATSPMAQPRSVHPRFVVDSLSVDPNVAVIVVRDTAAPSPTCQAIGRTPDGVGTWAVPCLAP